MLAIVTIITAFIIGSSISEPEVPAGVTPSVTITDTQYWQHDEEIGWIYLAPDVEVESSIPIG